MLRVKRDDLRQMTTISLELPDEAIFQMDRDSFRKATGDALRSLHEAFLQTWDERHGKGQD